MSEDRIEERVRLLGKVDEGVMGTAVAGEYQTMHMDRLADKRVKQPLCPNLERD
jgi:hypothetical protein